jgi:hypothetical protein
VSVSVSIVFRICGPRRCTLVRNFGFDLATTPVRSAYGPTTMGTMKSAAGFHRPPPMPPEKRKCTSTTSIKKTHLIKSIIKKDKNRNKIRHAVIGISPSSIQATANAAAYSSTRTPVDQFNRRENSFPQSNIAATHSSTRNPVHLEERKTHDTSTYISTRNSVDLMEERTHDNSSPKAIGIIATTSNNETSIHNRTNRINATKTSKDKQDNKNQHKTTAARRNKSSSKTNELGNVQATGTETASVHSNSNKRKSVTLSPTSSTAKTSEPAATNNSTSVTSPKAKHRRQVKLSNSTNQSPVRKGRSNNSNKNAAAERTADAVTVRTGTKTVRTVKKSLVYRSPFTQGFLNNSSEKGPTTRAGTVRTGTKTVRTVKKSLINRSPFTQGFLNNSSGKGSTTSAATVRTGTKTVRTVKKSLVKRSPFEMGYLNNSEKAAAVQTTGAATVRTGTKPVRTVKKSLINRSPFEQGSLNNNSEKSAAVPTTGAATVRTGTKTVRTVKNSLINRSPFEMGYLDKNSEKSAAVQTTGAATVRTGTKTVRTVRKSLINRSPFEMGYLNNNSEKAAAAQMTGAATVRTGTKTVRTVTNSLINRSPSKQGYLNNNSKKAASEQTTGAATGRTETKTVRTVKTTLINRSPFTQGYLHNNNEKATAVREREESAEEAHSNPPKDKDSSSNNDTEIIYDATETINAASVYREQGDKAAKKAPTLHNLMKATSPWPSEIFNEKLVPTGANTGCDRLGPTENNQPTTAYYNGTTKSWTPHIGANGRGHKKVQQPDRKSSKTQEWLTDPGSGTDPPKRRSDQPNNKNPTSDPADAGQTAQCFCHTTNKIQKWLIDPGSGTTSQTYQVTNNSSTRDPAYAGQPPVFPPRWEQPIYLAFRPLEPRSTPYRRQLTTVIG